MLGAAQVWGPGGQARSLFSMQAACWSWLLSPRSAGRPKTHGLLTGNTNALWRWLATFSIRTPLGVGSGTRADQKNKTQNIPSHLRPKNTLPTSVSQTSLGGIVPSMSRQRHPRAPPRPGSGGPPLPRETGRRSCEYSVPLGPPPSGFLGRAPTSPSPVASLGMIVDGCELFEGL